MGGRAHSSQQAQEDCAPTVEDWFLCEARAGDVAEEKQGVHWSPSRRGATGSW